MLNNQDYKNIISEYGVNFQKRRTDINIQGTPSRTLNRFAFEDKNSNIYIFEKIKFGDLKIKKRIAKNLDNLRKKGFPVANYLSTYKTDKILEYKLRNFQLKEYIPGNNLKRPDYLNDNWRAISSADFLIDLYKNSQNLDVTPYPISLKRNIHQMILDFKTKNGKYFNLLKDVIDQIKNNFLKFESKIPKRFCHGDFHPMNIVWGKDKINGVIDWEFSGNNYEIYDIANFIGCVGMEDPSYLSSSFLRNFVNRIKKEEIIQEESWKYMKSFLIALRFGGWLSHWLKKKDYEMIDLEINYLKYLLNNLISY